MKFRRRLDGPKENHSKLPSMQEVAKRIVRNARSFVRANLLRAPLLTVLAAVAGGSCTFTVRTLPYCKMSNLDDRSDKFIKEKRPVYYTDPRTGDVYFASYYDDVEEEMIYCPPCFRPIADNEKEGINAEYNPSYAEDPDTGEDYLESYAEEGRRKYCEPRDPEGDYDSVGGGGDAVLADGGPVNGDSIGGDSIPGDSLVGDSFGGDSFGGDSMDGDTIPKGDETIVNPPALNITNPVPPCDTETVLNISGAITDPANTTGVQYKTESGPETEWQDVPNYATGDDTFSIDLGVNGSFVFRTVDDIGTASDPSAPVSTATDITPPADPTVTNPINTCEVDSLFDMNVTSIDPETEEVIVDKEGTEISRATVAPGETDKTFTFPNDAVNPDVLNIPFVTTSYGVKAADSCGNETAPMNVDVNRHEQVEVPFGITVNTNPTPGIVTAGGYQYYVIAPNLYGESFDVEIQVIDLNTGDPLPGDPGTFEVTRMDIMAGIVRNAIATLTTPPPVAAPEDHIIVRVTFNVHNPGGANCSTTATHVIGIYN